MPNPHFILITVEGGVVQSIENIPPGIVVVVHDFDRCDGANDVTEWTADGPRKAGAH